MIAIDSTTDVSTDSGRWLDVALVNNMPDAALRQTERQFTALLDANPDLSLRLWRFNLPGVARAEAAQEYLRERYLPLERLWSSPCVAVVITGCEPHSADLRSEPYWDELVRLLRWSRDHAVSTVASCLAAHAALLAFDGVERQPLPVKLSGVYAQAVAADHRLTAGLPDHVDMPHSRRNDVPTEALVAGGYRSLIGSAEAGWTVAVRDDDRHRVVLMQGHPEYDADTLLLEFRRDVRRYLHGERDTYPDVPVNCLASTAAPVLSRLHEEALSGGQPAFPFAELSGQVRGGWHEFSRGLFANWLDDVSRRVSAKVAV